METDESFDSCSSCKWLEPSRLHELHKSKLLFVLRIEYIRSKIFQFSYSCIRGSVSLQTTTTLRPLQIHTRYEGAKPEQPISSAEVRAGQITMVVCNSGLGLIHRGPQKQGTHNYYNKARAVRRTTSSFIRRATLRPPTIITSANSGLRINDLARQTSPTCSEN